MARTKKSKKESSEVKVVKENSVPEATKDKNTPKSKKKLFHLKKRKKRKETLESREEGCKAAKNNIRLQSSLKTRYGTATKMSKTEKKRKTFRNIYRKNKDIRSSLASVAEDGEANQHAVNQQPIPGTSSKIIHFQKEVEDLKDFVQEKAVNLLEEHDKELQQLKDRSDKLEENAKKFLKVNFE